MTDTILPHELPTALERAPDGIKLLSLDCFDTLLWRDCHAPTDVFAGLSKLTIRQRAAGESHARKAMATLQGRTEVSLNDIYAEAMPRASSKERAAAIEEELALEAQTCFAFQPTVELMREAKRRGLKVIIVSDTYLDAGQLGDLIAKAAGAEVAGLIDRIFASSELGISKSQGLLAKAQKAMRCAPREILHIGDNEEADFKSARALGIPALHLAQFAKTARQRLRFERSLSRLIGEEAGRVRGLQPHRAILSREEPVIEDRATALGFTVLGPVFYGFDRWLRAEADDLKQTNGGMVHWLFMLRDGHLPHLVHQAGEPAPSTARVEISRFVGIAASLTSSEAYTRQYAREHGLKPSTLARQMLFTEEEISDLVGDERTADQRKASRDLLAELRTGQRQKITRRRARERAERLIAHVRRAVDPQPGDTLMLVDLGYNGSAQDRIDPILSKAFNCHVAGRYLLLREMAATGLDKKGLIDARHFDADLLEAMCENVAVIEQLATCELGSVVDFTDAGEPIRKQSTLKGTQSVVRDAVQAGATRFAAAAHNPPVIRPGDANSDAGWRDAAVSVLGRFMFLPQPGELAVLWNFEHDVNLGSERMVALFDEAHAGEAMKRRGLFYMKGSSRMFLPAELAQEDINTRLSLLTQKRFGLGFSYEDTASRTLSLPAIYLGKQNEAHSVVEAQPTHDGYYVARLPLVADAQGIALQLGSVFEWFELASVSASRLDSLKGKHGSDDAPKPLSYRLDGMSARAHGIVECTDPGAFLLVLPPRAGNGSDPQMVEVVLRPLRRRPSVRKDAAGLNVKPNSTPLPFQENAA